MEEEKSRSQRKREVEALQKLGVRLAKLSPDQLRRFPIPEKLREAVEQLQRAKKNEARRRQTQYIGALMRSIDPAPIEEAFENLDQSHAMDVATEHRVERWRDRLLDGDDDLIEEIASRSPTADRQRLRRLVRNARKADEGPARTRASRALFRYLREVSPPMGGGQAREP